MLAWSASWAPPERGRATARRVARPRVAPHPAELHDDRDRPARHRARPRDGSRVRELARDALPHRDGRAAARRREARRHLRPPPAAARVTSVVRRRVSRRGAVERPRVAHRLPAPAGARGRRAHAECRRARPHRDRGRAGQRVRVGRRRDGRRRVGGAGPRRRARRRVRLARDLRSERAARGHRARARLGRDPAGCAPGARPRRARFDVVGAVGLSVILAGAAWTLSRLRSESAAVLTALTGALVVCAIALVRYERAREDPIVQPRLFRDRTFAAANGTIALSNCAMYATMLAVPVVIARSAEPGTAALSSGAALTALFATSVVLSPAGGRLADRVGRRWPSVGGHVLYAVGALVVVAAPAALIPGLLVSGVGLGLLAGGLRAAAVETVEPERAGLASGIFSTSRYAGGIVGALLVSLLLDEDRDASGLFVACALTASLAAALSLLLEDWPAPDPVAL